MYPFAAEKGLFFQLNITNTGFDGSILRYIQAHSGLTKLKKIF